MRDRAAERRLRCCARRVGVDELEVARRLGEVVDGLLCHSDPVGDADLLADQAPDIGERDFLRHVVILMEGSQLNCSCLAQALEARRYDCRKLLGAVARRTTVTVVGDRAAFAAAADHDKSRMDLP